MQNYKKIAFILSALVLTSIAGYLAFAWTEPTQAPPEGNVPTPINVGSVAQTKQGALQINADFTANRLLDSSDNSYYVDPANTSYSALFAGSIGIGTTNPQGKLDISGGCLAVNGSCGTSGQVLTSQGAGVVPHYVTPSPPEIPVMALALSVFRLGQASGTYANPPALIDNNESTYTGGTLNQYATVNFGDIRKVTTIRLLRTGVSGQTGIGRVKIMYFNNSSCAWEDWLVNLNPWPGNTWHTYTGSEVATQALRLVTTANESGSWPDMRFREWEAYGTVGCQP